MVFYNNPQAARAILDNRRERLHDDVATRREALIANDSRIEAVAALPRSEPVVRSAAA